MTSPIFPVKIHGTSLIILRMRTTSSMTTNPSKRKLWLIFAPVGAGGMIPIHHLMKLIQASFREWDHQSPRLPHSRERSKKRRKSSWTPILVNPAQLSRLCTERANPLLHQFSSTKTNIHSLTFNIISLSHRKRNYLKLSIWNKRLIFISCNGSKK